MAFPAEQFEIVVGLEVHAQLLTQTKIFNSDPASYGGAPNSHVGVITLAHPGTLPKLNEAVIEQAIKMGLACHSTISRYQIFDRKNYFYPDLPKGYQLTQDRTPICNGGFIAIRNREGHEKEIPLNRIHLEEDAGKSIHVEGERDTLLDFNRAGVALIEIVTEPAIHSSEDAALTLMEIRKLVRYLNICDGNMEEGSLRCDANVSVRLRGTTALGKKVEVKNMNSFRHVQRAIDYEAERQANLLLRGENIVSETRTFNVNDGKTYGMRTKEELNDYRYFPDPDLSPVKVSDEWLSRIESLMPALPAALFKKFVNEYQLPVYDAQILTEEREMAEYFEQLSSINGLYKDNSNWLMGPVKSYLNEKKISITEWPVSTSHLAALIRSVNDRKLSHTAAVQQVLPHLIANPNASPDQVMSEMKLGETDASSLDGLLDEIIKEFPLKVEEYHRGKKGIVAMFMGEVKKRTQGQVDFKSASDLLTEKLNALKAR